MVGFGHEKDAFLSVVFLESHLDILVRRSRYRLPDIVRLDGQFAMAPVDENSQLNFSRPTIVHQSVKRCSDRSPGKDNFVKKDRARSIDRKRDIGTFEAGKIRPVSVEVVSIQGNVERSDGIFLSALFEHFCDAASESYPSSKNSDKGNIVINAAIRNSVSQNSHLLLNSRWGEDFLGGDF
jgi:hypothetical protein